MPNYRYHTAGQMRQNGCMRQNPPAMPQVGGCPLPTENICNPDMDHGDLADMSLAMAYVPWQEWRNIYKAEKAFQRGTIFEELDKPFRGMGGVCPGRAYTSLPQGVVKLDQCGQLCRRRYQIVSGYSSAPPGSPAVF